MFVHLDTLQEIINAINALANVKFAVMKHHVLLVIQDTILKMDYALKTVEMVGLLIPVDNADNAQKIVSNVQPSIMMIVLLVMMVSSNSKENAMQLAQLDLILKKVNVYLVKSIA
jgi:hypothetical protein